MHILGQKFILISLGLSQKKRNSKVATLELRFSVYIESTFIGPSSPATALDELIQYLTYTMNRYSQT